MVVFKSTIEVAKFDILADVQARYRAAVDREIRNDLDRMVAHLARVHNVPQDRILEILEVYPQEKLTK